MDTPLYTAEIRQKHILKSVGEIAVPKKKLGIGIYVSLYWCGQPPPERSTEEVRKKYGRRGGGADLV